MPEKTMWRFEGMNWKNRLAGFLVGCFLLLSGAAWAQESGDAASPSSGGSAVEKPKDETDWTPKFGMGLQFGTMTVNGVNWNSIRFQPDFGIGKFGIGLDLNFEFDADGNFRASEWNTWQAVLSKILYVRWGLKGEPVFVKVGGVNDFTFGNGFLVNLYSNMLNYPSVKKLGIAFDLDLDSFGFETMVDNIFDWDILGLRAFVRPLSGTELFLVNRLEIGATLAADLDPQNPAPPADRPYDFRDGTNSQPVVVFGADVGLPLVNIPNIFFLKTYADFGAIAGKGTGEALGIGGRIVTVVPYKLEARLFQPQFTPYYFDSYYDAVRSVKYQSLDFATNHVFGWLFNTGIALLEDKLVATFEIEGTFEPGSRPALTFNFLLSRELLKIIGIRFTWTRQNIASAADIFTFEDANSLFLLGIDYAIAPNLILSLDYKRTFQIGSDGLVQPFTSTSISTKIAF